MKVKGTLSVTKRGFGFVTPTSEKVQEDIFIPKRYLHRAIDKDIVEVEITAVKEKGPEGQIVKVIKRSKKHFIATILSKSKKKYKTIISFPDKQEVVFVKTDKKLKNGDKIEINVSSWKEPIFGKFINYLGNINDPSIDNDIALIEFDINTKFPEKVKEEIKSFQKDISKNDLKDRENFLKLTCITIDPENAKDLDDAISCIIDKKGNYRLGVHIADVSHFVRKDTFLDKEAYERANSTYFPDFVSPMLPEKISL